MQPFFPLREWIEVGDGNDDARAIFDRHYSRYIYKDGRTPLLFVGPGQKLVLVTPCLASPNPGYCFKAAGWKRVGRTKARRYDILAFEG